MSYYNLYLAFNGIIYKEYLLFFYYISSKLL